MREIKFRGKRIADGDWFYGDLITKVDGDFNITNSYIHIRLSGVDFSEDSMTSKLCLHEVDPKTVGQYTGLKDKNGKEGFESDIVGLEDTLGEQFYGVIKWIGDKKAMYVIEMSGSHYPMSLLSDCEIIGNVYSNPELLEVTP